MVKTQETAKEIGPLQNLLKQYVDDIQIRECSNQGGNKIENNDIAEIDEKNLLGSLRDGLEINNCCPDVFGRIVITPEGYVSACVVDYQYYLITGDTRKHSLKEIWESEVYKNLRLKH